MLLMYTAIIDAIPERSRFEEIYHTYHKQMLYVALDILHNMEDAQDAVQNALWGIAKTVKAVPQDEKIEKAYVLTAAKYAALTIAQKRLPAEYTQDILEMNIAASDNLFEKVVSNENYELLLRAIRQLESPYGEVLMLVYVQELTVKAAAEILCRKEETVKKQLQRGKKKLIELCQKEGMCLE